MGSTPDWLRPHRLSDASGRRGTFSIVLEDILHAQMSLLVCMLEKVLFPFRSTGWHQTFFLITKLFTVENLENIQREKSRFCILSGTILRKLNWSDSLKTMYEKVKCSVVSDSL